MTSPGVRWMLAAGLLSLVLLGTALSLSPAVPTPAYAGDLADKLVDINSASEEQLKELPGIGDALAARIVKHRPYKRKDDLVDKKVIPEAAYERIKHQIIAKQR